MSTKQNEPKAPRLCTHKTKSGEYGYATFDGQQIRYGRMDDPRTFELYAQDVRIWRANGYQLPDDDEAAALDTVEVRELVTRYREHLIAKRGKQWLERGGIRTHYAIKPLEDLQGSTLVSRYTPKKLKALRDTMICGGKLSRGEINARLARIKACFKWGVSEELVTKEVSYGLSTVENLEAGDYGTRDNDINRDLCVAHVETTLQHLSKDFADVIRIMLETGARPSEVLRLRAEEVVREGDLWHALLANHKMAYKGKPRVLVFTKAAQTVLMPRMLRSKGGLLFKGRKGAYDYHALQRAVQRACTAAKVKPWTPYAIRHHVATQIATKLDEQDAGVVLGHSSGKVTARYVHNLIERTKVVVRRWQAA